MEEASEETEEVMVETGGGDTSTLIINRDVIPELQLIFILSLIIFGLLDGIFAYLMWSSKPPFSNDKILMPLSVLQLLNRLFSGYVIVMISVTVVVVNNPRTLLNALYLLIIASTCTTIIIMVIIKKKVLEGKKATKILFKSPEKTTL